MDAAPIPAPVGQYRPEEVVGKGWLSRVCRARDTLSGKTVALRLPLEELEDSHVAHFRDRCRNERLLRGDSLRHPALVPVLDAQPDARLPFTVMEYVPGVDLREAFVAGGTFGVQQVAGWAADLLSGLQHLHDAGVVWRNVNPANLFAQGDRLRLGGFGASWFEDSAVPANLHTGSPRFFSPEQVLEQAVDARSDVFAAGSVLYWMLCGEDPFADAQSPAIRDVLDRIKHARPRPPSSRRRDLPAGLDDVLLRALARQPQDRWRSAHEFATALRGVLGPTTVSRLRTAAPAATQPAASVAPSPPPRVSKPPLQAPAVATASASAAPAKAPASAPRVAKPAATAQPAGAIPRRLGRYELLRIVGKGAFGLVYEGRDSVVGGRQVAVKVISLDAADDPEHWHARFRTEALAAARLSHPNIVPIYDYGREEGLAYLVMALVEGETLKALVDRAHRYRPEAVVAIVLDLLGALDHAHANGIVHRDVKPSNIMVERGRARLMNFASALMPSQGGGTTLALGSPKYMAPEQAQGLAVDRRADLWGVGVILYELLAGVPPFRGDNAMEVLQKVIWEDPPALPSELRPGLPRRLDDVVRKALAKKRRDRFESARDFAIALKAAILPAGAAAARPARAPAPAPAPQAVPPTVHGGAATSATTVPPARTDPISLELELEFWKDIKESDEVDAFEDFLREFPHGKFAHLARRRVAQLRGGLLPAEPVKVVHTGPTTDAARASGATAKDLAPGLAEDLGDENGPEMREGATVRDLVVRQHLNSGGFGIVYKAYDPGLDIEVALKEYLPRSLSHRDRAGQVRPFRDPHSQELFRKGLDSFLNEGRLLARVDHPALAKVQQAFQANGTGYIVMKLYRGLTLKETLRRDPTVVTEAWLRSLLVRVGGALQTLHSQHIYHRDIAPDNIILHEGRDPVVLDFGAARQVVAQADATLTAIYKPGFAPVEQYGDDDALRQGAWTDVYALCATIHYAICGRPPIPAPMRMRHDPQVPLAHTAAGRYSERFLAALDRGLSAMPEERPRSIEDLLQAMGF